MIRLCSFNDFCEQSKSRNVVLIGAGKMGRKLFEENNWNIGYAVDNNPEINGDILSCEDKTIAIHDWDYLRGNVKKSDILLITPKAKYFELIEAIDNDIVFKDIDVYVHQFLLDFQWDEDRIRESEKPFEITRKQGRRIPRIIHYFWFSGDAYPDSVKKCIDSWQKFCPDYEFKKWDLTNYETTNTFCNEALSMKEWAFASDYGRCDVVYRYGGIYLDTDVELIRPLDDLLYDEGFFCFESAEGVDPGSGMAAVKGNAVLAEIREQYNDIHFINSDNSLNKINILKQYTKVLVDHGLICNGYYQNLDGIAVYPPLVFSPYSYRTGIDSRSNITYGVHHWVSAWISNEARKEKAKRIEFITNKINSRSSYKR